MVVALKHLLLQVLRTLFVRPVLQCFGPNQNAAQMEGSKRLPRALWSEQTFQPLHGSLSQTRRLAGRMFAISACC